MVKELHFWDGDDRPQLLCPGCDDTKIMLQKLCGCGQPVVTGYEYCVDCLEKKEQEEL